MSKKVYKKIKKDKNKKNNIKRLSSIYPIFTILFCLSVALFISFENYYLNLRSFVSEINIFSIGYLENSPPSLTQVPYNIPLSNQWQNLLYGRNIGISSNLTQKITKQELSIGSNKIIWHGPRSKKEIALTFDADMTPIMVWWLHTGQVDTYDDTRITNYLSAHQIPSTFFLTGLWAESYPNATRELAQNPLFEIENHTYSHPSMAGYCFDQPQIPQSQYSSEIEKTQQILKKIADVTPHYFRFPGGCYNQSDLNLVKDEGLQTVHWDVVANDGFNNNEQQVISNVLNETQNGSIIVMHIGGPTTNTPVTALALPIIVNALKKRGFEFVTVSELLNTNIASNKIDPKTYLSSLETFQDIP